MPPKAKTKTCSYDSTLARGGWVKALCIGVDEYQHLAALANCVRDARAIAQKVQGNCFIVLHPSVRAFGGCLSARAYVHVHEIYACVHAHTHTYTKAMKRER
jgi:hypothetical protein